MQALTMTLTDPSERRVSARTETTVDVVLKRGKRLIRGKTVDLSQTGILIEHPAIRKTASQKPIELLIQLPDGPARATVRPVRKADGHFAYAFVDLSENDQAMLTDYLFCQLVEEEPRSGIHEIPSRE